MSRGLLDYLRCAGLAVCLASQALVCAHAGTISITVLDPDGEPVPDVAVYISYETTAPRTEPDSAVMDQRDTTFVPHILVIQRGTSVEFPNSDVVAHHVYSFSKPNAFVLPLYKGDPHNPVTFEHDGIVTLGCNIHDDMLAYIVVVDTDAFGKTDDHGRFEVQLPDSARQVRTHIWSPRLRDANLSREVGGTGGEVLYALAKKLRPAHDPGSDALHWSEY